MGVTRFSTMVLLVLLGTPAPVSAQMQKVSADAALSPGAYRWNDEPAIAGPITITVNIPRQHMLVYRGDALIGVAAISSGKPGHRTPTGTFPILQKNMWHRSNLYSNAPMPYMQRLTWSGIAIHGGHNPGYPASHGCIRVPTAFAKKLFAITTLGARVAVLGGDPATPPLYLTIKGLEYATLSDSDVTLGPVREAQAEPVAVAMTPPTQPIPAPPPVKIATASPILPATVSARPAPAPAARVKTVPDKSPRRVEVARDDQTNAVIAAKIDLAQRAPGQVIRRASIQQLPAPRPAAQIAQQNAGPHWANWDEIERVRDQAASASSSGASRIR